VSGVRPGGLEDRYVAPLEANRRGAHRARPNPLLGVLPLVAVAAVVIAVAGGVITLLGDGLLPSKGDKTVAGSPIGATKTTPAAKPSATGSTPVKSSAPVVTPPASRSSSPTDTTSTVDKSVKVVVHNGTSTTGLAAKVTTLLYNHGWAKAETMKGKTAGITKTTVYYARSSLKAEAEALISTELGNVGEAVQSSSSAKSGGSIGVFIGPDYTP
jgi:hypothetical protein